MSDYTGEPPEDRKAEDVFNEIQRMGQRDSRIVKTKDTNPKDAIGIKKPPLSTIPLPVLFEVGVAMLEGACKYRRHNYRVAGVRATVYFDAAWRHLADWYEGQDIDPDSGLHHVSKAIASLVVLRDAMMNDKVIDDRPPPAKADWMKLIQEHMDDVLARHPDPKPPYTNNPDLEIGL
jgi:hypothetical protein